MNIFGYNSRHMSVEEYVVNCDIKGIKYLTLKRLTQHANDDDLDALIATFKEISILTGSFGQRNMWVCRYVMPVTMLTHLNDDFPSFCCTIHNGVPDIRRYRNYQPQEVVFQIVEPFEAQKFIDDFDERIHAAQMDIEHYTNLKNEFLKAIETLK